MLKNKNFIFFTALGLGLLGSMLIVAFSASSQAKAVSNSVLRFHIVANSDSEQDQALKLKVRDGIAALSDELFSKSQSKQQAIDKARENTELIKKTAQEILRKNNCNDSVSVEIKNLYFPTKSYEEITFPAGNYDAIHITLGEGKGQNFWCVMFPALCVPSATKNGTELLSDVLEEEQLGLVTHPYTVKFKAAEWLGIIKNWFKR